MKDSLNSFISTGGNKFVGGLKKFSHFFPDSQSKNTHAQDKGKNSKSSEVLQSNLTIDRTLFFVLL